MMISKVITSAFCTLKLYREMIFKELKLTSIRTGVLVSTETGSKPILINSNPVPFLIEF